MAGRRERSVMAAGREIDSVMVLAAGHATRLRPLTDHRAKAVVSFLNRPILDYTLDWLARVGFDEVVINLHHCPDSIRGRYGDRAFGMRLRFCPEEKLLGTAGGPRAALDLLGQTTLLVNGDIVTGLSLGPLLRHHRDAGALATLALHAGPTAGSHPAIPTGSLGRILGFSAGEAEAAGEHACFTGVHLVERQVFELVPPDRPCGIVDPVYRQLLAEGLPLHGIAVPGPWYEAGSVDRYIDSQMEALGREELPLAFHGYRRVAPGAYLQRFAGWGRAGMEPPFLLGEYSSVADAAALRGTVAGRRVRIGEGAMVVDSVLLDGARVGTGARLERAVVLENAYVPPGAVVRSQVWTGAPASADAAVHAARCEP